MAICNLKIIHGLVTFPFLCTILHTVCDLALQSEASSGHVSLIPRVKIHVVPLPKQGLSCWQMSVIPTSYIVLDPKAALTLGTNW